MQEIKYKIEIIEIGKVKTNDLNPRKIIKEKFAKLKKSLQDLPKMQQLRPLVIDENMVVLGGNMRLQAMKELKFTHVPVIFANDLTEEEKKEFIVKDNLEYGEWDWDRIANDYDIDQLEMWGFDMKNWGETGEAEAVFEEKNYLEVCPPEAPRLKERLQILCKDMEEYDLLKKAFENGRLSKDILIKLVEEENI